MNLENKNYSIPQEDILEEYIEGSENQPTDKALGKEEKLKKTKRKYVKKEKPNFVETIALTLIKNSKKNTGQSYIFTMALDGEIFKERVIFRVLDKETNKYFYKINEPEIDQLYDTDIIGNCIDIDGTGNCFEILVRVKENGEYVPVIIG